MSQKGSELLLLGANVMGIDIERKRDSPTREREKLFTCCDEESKLSIEDSTLGNRTKS